jgi:hypothetical protein
MVYVGENTLIAERVREAAPVLARHPVLRANAFATLRKASALNVLRTGGPLPSALEAEPTPRLSPYDDLALRFAAWLEEVALARASAGGGAPADPRMASAGIAALRVEGRAAGLHEFPRECSLWEGILSLGGDGGVTTALGTPFSGFFEYASRVATWARIEGRLGEGIGSVLLSDVNLVESSLSPDLATTAVDPWADAGLAPALARMLAVLCSDVHRPATIERLFLETHPDAHFQPGSSPQAVHTTLSRLRAAFEARGWDWMIEGTPGVGFCLRARTPALVLPGRHAISSHVVNGSDGGLRALIAVRFAGRTFTTAEIAEAAGFHPRKTTRMLARLEEEGVVERLGRGSALA